MRGDEEEKKDGRWCVLVCSVREGREEDSQLKARGSKRGEEKRRENQWTDGARSDNDKGQQ